MKAKVIIAIISFLFLTLYPLRSTATSNNNYSIHELINSIKDIRKYQVNLITKIFFPSSSDSNPNVHGEHNPNGFMEIKSVVFGESGKKMKIITTVNSPELGVEMENMLIFDGMWLWVQQKMNKDPHIKTPQPNISAIKIHIPSVSPDPVNEPFNTIYGITGTGLLRYKDLPGTFLELLKRYSFSKVMKSSNSKEILFSGIKKHSEKDEEIKIADKELNEFLDKGTNFCKLWVSENDNRIVAYFIGKSEKSPTMKTKIDYITVNEQLPENIFLYIPPKGVVVRDVTDHILKQNKLGE